MVEIYNSEVRGPVFQEGFLFRHDLCPATDDFPCNQCPLVFSSLAAVRRYQVSTHGYRNPLNLRVSGTRCLCCRKEFWTRGRMVQHVAVRSLQCKAFYQEHVEPMSLVDSDALDRAARLAPVDSKAVPLPIVQY